MTRGVANNVQQKGTAVEFGKDISKMSTEDLPKYEDFLFNKLLGVAQPESRRVKLLDRIKETHEEIKTREPNGN